MTDALRGARLSGFCLNLIDDHAKRAGIPLDKVVVNIERYGNTSAATIPLALWDAESQLKKGGLHYRCGKDSKKVP